MQKLGEPADSSTHTTVVENLLVYGKPQIWPLSPFTETTPHGRHHTHSTTTKGWPEQRCFCHPYHIPRSVHHINSNERSYQTRPKPFTDQGRHIVSTNITTSDTRANYPPFGFALNRAIPVIQTECLPSNRALPISSWTPLPTCQLQEDCYSCSLYWPCKEWKGSYWWVDVYQGNQSTHGIQIELTRIEPKDGHHGSQGCCRATQGCMNTGIGMSTMRYGMCGLWGNIFQGTQYEFFLAKMASQLCGKDRMASREDNYWLESVTIWLLIITHEPGFKHCIVALEEILVGFVL